MTNTFIFHFFRGGKGDHSGGLVGHGGGHFGFYIK